MERSVNIAIHNDRGEILILKRSPDDFSYPNLWDLPGGKVEDSETLEEAVLREAKEESGLDVKIEGQYFNTYHYSDRDIYIYSFKAKLISDKVTISAEHAEFRWISKDEYKNFEYTPSVEATIKEFFEKK